MKNKVLVSRTPPRKPDKQRRRIHPRPSQGTHTLLGPTEAKDSSLPLHTKVITHLGGGGRGLVFKLKGQYYAVEQESPEMFTELRGSVGKALTQ